MRILGLESTAHTFAASTVDEEEIYTNEKDMFEPDEGGIHPREAAEHHYQKAEEVIKRGLEEPIDAVAFSQGPGIPQCLDVGAVAARTLAQEHQAPLIGVNHCVAHIEIGKRTTEAERPTTLYLSGGNSQVMAEKNKEYRIIGETLDIALGNAVDKLARKMGYPHPGGPEIEKLAEQTDEILEIAYPVKGMDFSFSGITTELQKKIGDVDDTVIANTFQEHAYAATVEALERAMSQTNSNEALLTGGVAMNYRLREMVESMCEQRGAEAYFIPPEYCMDNAAMIAERGLKKAKRKEFIDIKDSRIKRNWRPDRIKV
ncbi:MAG: KEOPS complex N(6)-L-threonylcarbamoyladenine synthase Kae1 [Candidatus Nanohaloarchaea archaeon]